MPEQSSQSLWSDRSIPWVTVGWSFEGATVFKKPHLSSKYLWPDNRDA